MRQHVRETIIDTLSSRYPGLHHRFLSVIVDQVPNPKFPDLIFDEIVASLGNAILLAVVSPVADWPLGELPRFCCFRLFCFYR